MGELAEADAELAGMYLECAARHRGLTEWAEKIQHRAVVD